MENATIPVDEVLLMHDCPSGNDDCYGHDHLFLFDISFPKNAVSMVKEKDENDP